MGRVTTYDPDVAATICARMADGESLRSICSSQEMPTERCVRSWALTDAHGFKAQYAQARELQAARWVEEIVDLADDERNAENSEQLGHARLRVDTRKWIASKILPKQYGDKVTSEITGADGAPLLPTLSVVVKRE